MKHLLFCLAFLSLPSMAADNSKSSYDDAAFVEAFNASLPRGKATYKAVYEHLDVNVVNGVKKFGSEPFFACEKRTIAGKAMHLCYGTEGAKQDAAIYEALKLEAKNITPKGILGSVTHEKSIAGFRCTKKEAVVPHPKPEYACAMKTDWISSPLNPPADESTNSAE